jgi:hypothetical protein
MRSTTFVGNSLVEVICDITEFGPQTCTADSATLEGVPDEL